MSSDAVTSNCAEVILCALTEAINGQELDRYAAPELAAAA